MMMVSCLLIQCVQNIDDVDLDELVIGNRVISLADAQSETEVRKK
jgi:hypothetical protein